MKWKYFNNFLCSNRNKKNYKARNATIDFNNVRDPSVSMDIDSTNQGAYLLDVEDEDDIF